MNTQQMWATRVTLNPRSPHTRELLADPHVMHGFTMRAFAGTDRDTARADNKVLWRADTHHGTPVITIQAGTSFDPQAWVGHSAVDSVTEPVDLAARFAGRTKSGSRWRFMTRVCATTVKSVPGSARGTRTPITDHEALTEWLIRQSRGAFSLAVDDLWGGVDVAIDSEGPVVSSSKGATLNSTAVRGVLDVQDPDRFVQVLSTGLGRGRAYGFGLLHAVPAA